jgi:hypothetical protein
MEVGPGGGIGVSRGGRVGWQPGKAEPSVGGRVGRWPVASGASRARVVGTGSWRAMAPGSIRGWSGMDCCGGQRHRAVAPGEVGRR